MTTRPVTVFNDPQFPLIPDTEERVYANVENTLSLMDESGAVPKKYEVVIPTALFTMMRQVFKISPLDSVFLYIVQDGEYWIFGIAWGLEGYADLWTYTDASLPTFFKEK